MPAKSAYAPQIPQPNFSRRLKVVFDVSVLGFGQYEESGRTGVYRVVESVGACLAASQLVDLSLSSSECLEMWASTANYLPTDPRFQGLSLLGPRFTGSLYGSARSAHRNLTKPELFPPLRIVRGSLKRFMNLLDKTVKPLSGRHLREQDIFHSPYWAIPEAAKRSKKIRKILTVHDVLSIVHPETGTEGGAFLKTILSSVTQDDWVICVSEWTREELLTVHPGLDPMKVRVIPSAASSLFKRCTDPAQIDSVLRKYSIPTGQFLLSVCTLEKRKNMEHLVRCFAEVIRSQKIDDLNLVLVGSKSNSTPRIEALVRELGLPPGRVHLTGYVDDSDLSALYSQAMAFVYPSLWEGFGLPPLEAMQCGTPVLCSNSSSLPEVVGDAGLLFHPKDATALCDAIHKVYADELLRKSLSARSMLRAKQFSWEATVDRLVALYYEAI